MLQDPSVPSPSYQGSLWSWYGLRCTGLGSILYPAGHKVSLADRWPSSDQRLPRRWKPPQGKQLATVQEVLHRSSRGRAGVCITICRVIYISYINYPTCNLLTTPGLNITTLVKGKKNCCGNFTDHTQSG